ncbi:squalene/phytoene synthase family protein [Hyphomonadaceae bacterium BL14]|nr:squalene/phytoene synthase family protein [Hyphomonadaceae bacterium BL14]
MTERSFEAALQRDDPDRWMAALFAPADTRARLVTLYAFYHEIARVPDAVSEPVIGEMRLSWARDAVRDLYASPPKVRRHDVYEALAPLTRVPGAPDARVLDQLIEARAADLGQGPFPTRQDRRDYVDRTAGVLMAAAARLAAPETALNETAQQALTEAGRLWGLTGLIRAFAPLCAAGRPPLATDEAAGAGLTESDWLSGRKPDAARAALAGLIAEAEASARALASLSRALPADMFPAIGYVSLAPGYLRRARHVADPFREIAEPPLFTRQLRLTWASLTGRI